MIIKCEPGVQLSAFLRKCGASPDTPCGGRGNCGKCRIRVVEGELPVSTMDRVHLSQVELDAGIRLACQALPKKPVTVEVLAR